MADKLNFTELDRANFWSRSKRLDNGCWEWTSSKTKKGYGHLGFRHKMFLAHRVSYELIRGKIPKGLVLDHLCKNRACINPDHLEPVTTHENILRGDSPAGLHARKLHCKRGHLLVGKIGKRACLICHRMYMKEVFLVKHPNYNTQWSKKDRIKKREQNPHYHRDISRKYRETIINQQLVTI